MSADIADQSRQQHWLMLVILAGGAIILLFAVGAKSLWIDELFTVRVAGQQDLGQLLRDCITLERRPPIHFVLMHFWMLIAGDSDTALRLPSVFFALLSLPLLAVLARMLGLSRLALAAPALLVVMPTFVLYSRMARAYSLTVAVGLLSTILFVSVLHHPGRRTWLAYLGCSTILLYTDYSLISLLLAQNLYVAYLASPLHARDAAPPRLRAWIAGQAIILLSFIPWLAIVVLQVQRGRLEADFATGLAGYLLKLAYPAYSLSVGETIFPWNPAAIAGILCAGILFVAGAIAIARTGHALVVLVLASLIIPFLFTAFLLSSVATDITFINTVSHTLFAAPFFALTVAAGIAALPTRPWRMAAIAVLALAWGAALFNYYTDRDFHNPIYAVPMRQIVQQVIAQAQPGDIIVSDIDSGFAYYYARTRAATPSFAVPDQDDRARQLINSEHSPRVWLITLGRDRTRSDAPGDVFASWLAQAFTVHETRGYAQEDPLYRRLKERLLKRPDYEYKALVQLFVRR